MASNIPKAVDGLVAIGMIQSDQKEEVIRLFSDWQRIFQSNAGYQLAEAWKKSIPESMLQMTPELTYEDSLYLSCAVQESNLKKARKVFGF